MKKIIFLLFTVWVMSLAAGCRHLPAEVTLTPEYPEVEIAVGDTLLLALPANPTTGYQWNISVTENILQVTAENYTISRPAMIGSGGMMHWEISAVAAGEADICTRYYRPWNTFVPGKDREILWRIKVSDR